MTSDKRYHTGFISVYDFINHIYIQCPKCSNRAEILSDAKDRVHTRMACVHCGMNQHWMTDEEPKAMLVGKPVDCYFHYPVWLQCAVGEEILFAYNYEHLNFLEQFITARLRERSKDQYGWRNSSLQSRLPAWMLGAKNRIRVLKAIEKLKKK